MRRSVGRNTHMPKTRAHHSQIHGIITATEGRDTSREIHKNPILQLREILQKPGTLLAVHMCIKSRAFKHNTVMHARLNYLQVFGVIQLRETIQKQGTDLAVHMCIKSSAYKLTALPRKPG